MILPLTRRRGPADRYTRPAAFPRIAQYTGPPAASSTRPHAEASAPAPARAAGLNRRIMEVESNWLSPDGIPGRPWFKHMLYAARYTYAHLELPGITEAVEKKDGKTARSETRKLVNALARNTARLRDALGEMKRP